MEDRNFADIMVLPRNVEIRRVYAKLIQASLRVVVEEEGDEVCEG
jgi:hypothetical protein